MQNHFDCNRLALFTENCVLGMGKTESKRFVCRLFINAAQGVASERRLVVLCMPAEECAICIRNNIEMSLLFVGGAE